uniref:Uncharacterized protein n=1 Tax=Triticum urartu TaxID=4572 RepID=A0A8R7TZB6_TRIUA
MVRSNSIDSCYSSIQDVTYRYLPLPLPLPSTLPFLRRRRVH